MEGNASASLQQWREQVMQVLDEEGAKLTSAFQESCRQQIAHFMESQQLLETELGRKHVEMRTRVDSMLSKCPAPAEFSLDGTHAELKQQLKGFPSCENGGTKSSEMNEQDKTSQPGSASGKNDVDDTESSVKSEEDKTLEVVSAFQGSKDFLDSTAFDDPEAAKLNRRLLSRVAHSKSFNALVCVVICLYIVFVGVEVSVELNLALDDYDSGSMSRGGKQLTESPGWIKNSGRAFTAFFVAELIFRIVVFRWLYFVGHDWALNFMDTALVCLSVVGEMYISEATLLTTMIHLRFLRVLWICRALRVFGGLKSLRVVRDMRMIVLALRNSCVPLLWATTTLGMMFYFFSVVFMTFFAQHVRVAPLDDGVVESLRTWFTSLPMSTLALFMVVSGGVSWWDLMDPLISMSSYAAVLFVFFVLVTLLAVLNIITGIFVNDAIETARSDHVLAVAREMKNKESQHEDLKTLFTMLDFHQQGELTREDLKDVIHKDNVQAIFASLGIEASDARSLFRLLDVDGSHGIAIDEFVVGCSRLANRGSHVSMECSVTEIKNQMSTSFKHQRKHYAKLLDLEKQTQAMVKELLERQ